jgi:hypothetical protein
MTWCFMVFGKMKKELSQNWKKIRTRKGKEEDLFKFSYDSEQIFFKLGDSNVLNFNTVVGRKKTSVNCYRIEK